MRREFSSCPRCGRRLRKCKSISGPDSEFWLECEDCNTFVNTYIPQPHQYCFHTDPHRIIGNFGGYGSGKTTTTRMDLEKHLLLTPSANVLIGANVMSQYEQTLQRELEKDLPAAFVADYSAQKKFFDLQNGARVMYRPYDDADKLRSYNLTYAVCLEASEIKAPAYHMLKTRLRNRAATRSKTDKEGNEVVDEHGIPEIAHDWRKFVVESNPDSGWIRTDLLMVADDVTYHESLEEKYMAEELEIDPLISSHITATTANKYLPRDFVRQISRNKPSWWVNRYVNSSFKYAEGRVYPNSEDTVVETFQVPPDWKRMIAFDYGLHDDAVFLFVAIDDVRGVAYVYKEVRANELDLDALSQLYFQNTKDIPAGAIYAQLIDPKSGEKRDYNKDSLRDLFIQKGIYFKPGYISVAARVMRLNTYINSGKLKIMDCCRALLAEMREYKFPERQLGDRRGKDKPEDKNNHGINALEWIVMELPDNPVNMVLGVYDSEGIELSTIKKKQNNWLPHALEDPYPAHQTDTAFGFSPF